MDSRYYTCKGCFQVFDYGYGQDTKKFNKVCREIDSHQMTCKKYKAYRKREDDFWKKKKEAKC